MAREVQRGANAVEGVEATLWQVNMAKNAYLKKRGRRRGWGGFYYFVPSFVWLDWYCTGTWDTFRHDIAKGEGPFKSKWCGRDQARATFGGWWISVWISFSFWRDGIPVQGLLWFHPWVVGIPSTCWQTCWSLLEHWFLWGRSGAYCVSSLLSTSPMVTFLWAI